MRLINVNTLKLEEFIGDDTPSYAILSHRWGSEELTFKEVSKDRVDRSKSGYSKMKAACEIALSEHKLEWLWIDTCCIDKRSSAELTEAVNSMYGWYERATVCIIFLRDVECNTRDLDSRDFYETVSMGDTVQFEDSEWFSRAWTLQELLAPKQAYFYDRRWILVGTKVTLESRINASTQIPTSALRKEKNWDEFLIAQKMFWASRRKATREEDLAYSLLGLFDVNMPLLYGEGKKAFIRLQEEIIKVSTDRSFLIWGVNAQESDLLATSPSLFSDVPIDQYSRMSHSSTAFALTNLGLEIELDLTQSHTYGQYESEIVTLLDASKSYQTVLHYVLVLKLEQESDRLIKKGMIKKESPMYGAAAPTKTIVANKKCIVARRPLNSAQLVDEMHMINIHRETEPYQVPIIPFAYRKSDRWFRRELSRDPITGALQLADRSPGCPLDVIELSHTRTSSFKLWLRIFLDFDYYPCIHIDQRSLYESESDRYDPWDSDGLDISQWLESKGLEWKKAVGHQYAILSEGNGLNTSMVLRSSTRSGMGGEFFSTSTGSFASSRTYLQDTNQIGHVYRYCFNLRSSPLDRGWKVWNLSLSATHVSKPRFAIRPH